MREERRTLEETQINRSETPLVEKTARPQAGWRVPAAAIGPWTEAAAAISISAAISAVERRPSCV